jgi:predicted metalloprotease with PDZ domain
MNSVRYGIRATDPGAQVFQVTLDLPSPDPDGQHFTLPAWVPGSYLVRDLARNIVRLRALSQGRAVRVEKVDKHTWRCAAIAPGRPLSLAYEVHAGDPSVRGAHLDGTRGFFNGSSVFLLAQGWREAPCLVDIFAPEARHCAPPGAGPWRIATGLTPAAGTRRGAFGTYHAANYDELIDCPVEMGRFGLARFVAGSVEHEIAVTGAPARTDLRRLASDLARVCEAHIAMFEPRRRAAPFGRYAFLLLATPEGYGGLEHRNSTALVARRDDLPHAGMRASTDGYRRLLGLASHEYFHAWNVKRIRPAAFVPYDLARENYTRLLWFFEGFTSYYDDLALVRAGLLTPAQYLELVARNVNAVQQRSGRLKQTLAESSFDAWIKYYRPDENSPNAVVSYYQKGALVALGLDLTIRRATAGRRSLDHLMRLLWKRWREAGPSYAGVEEDGIGPAILQATGVEVSRQIAEWVHGTRDPDLAGLLPAFGVSFGTAPAIDSPHQALLGLRLAAGGGRVAHVLDGTAARAGGIVPGDELVAIDGARADSSARLDAVLGRCGAGEKVEVSVFRRDELLRLPVQLAKRPPVQWKLAEVPAASATAKRLRKGWLGS